MYIIISSVESAAGSDDDQGNMFSTFRMRNGEEYTVYNKDGKRYYVDWETQVSVYFIFQLQIYNFMYYSLLEFICNPYNL